MISDTTYCLIAAAIYLAIGVPAARLVVAIERALIPDEADRWNEPALAVVTVVAWPLVLALLLAYFTFKMVYAGAELMCCPRERTAVRAQPDPVVLRDPPRGVSVEVRRFP